MKGKLILFLLGKNKRIKYTNEPNIFINCTICPIIIFIFFLLCLPVLSQNDLRITPGWLYNDDPSVHVINNEFWIFHATDPFSEENPHPADWTNLLSYKALTTTDFQTFVDHGSIFNSHEVGWASASKHASSIWDGDAGIYANGMYYAYLPLGGEGGYSIGVFVSDKPGGPYNDALGRPLVTPSTPGVVMGDYAGLVSPSVIFDDEGNPWLYFGHYNINLLKLKSCMTELEGTHRLISLPNDFVEAGMIKKIGKKYYLLYSNGSVDKEPYSSNPWLRYSMSDSMFGPFTHKYTLVKQRTDQSEVSAHGDLAEYNGKIYVAYALNVTANRQARQLYLGTTSVDAEGSLSIIDSKNGSGVGNSYPKTFLLSAYAWKRECEEFISKSHADETPILVDSNGIKYDWAFKMKNNSWLKYPNVDFGDGAKGFKVELSCENRNIKDALLEFRIDSPEGKLVGAAEVKYTGDINHMVTHAAAVDSIQARGVHDLYLVSKGCCSDSGENLFNVNWYSFTKDFHAVHYIYGVNCGSSIAMDGLSADQRYTPGGWGYIGSTDTCIVKSFIYPSFSLPNALKTCRYAAADNGSFIYRFKVSNGNYAVELDFAEPFLEDYGSRTFDVSINGVKKLTDYDVFHTAKGGNQRGVQETIVDIDVTNGTLDILFTSKINRALINVIRIASLDDTGYYDSKVQHRHESDTNMSHLNE
jgi:arabinoxylan arabinofuranohydrolase